MSGFEAFIKARNLSGNSYSRSRQQISLNCFVFLPGDVSNLPKTLKCFQILRQVFFFVCFHILSEMFLFQRDCQYRVTNV